MSDVIVRATDESDLPRISDLTQRVFGVRRDVALLRWLLVGPRSPERIDSWIAEAAGEVVGHTGVLKSRYRVGGRWATGAHAFLWMATPELRGRAGYKLGHVILSYDDFPIILGGSVTTKAILAAKRFVQAAEAREYRISRESTLFPGLATVPDRAAAAGLELIPCFGDIREAPPLPAGVIANEAAPDHLEWLGRCPELETHLLALERGGRYLGPVLLFVNREVSPVAGRIVYLPYLGDVPEPWLAGLEVLARKLLRLGCASWTLLATHPALMRACEAWGAEVVGSRPVWIRERGELLSRHGAEPWHLTYLEGDLAYRRVEPGPPRGAAAEREAVITRS